MKRIKLQNKSSIFSFFSRGTRPSTRACVLGVCHPHGPYTGVYFGRVCPPVFLPSPVHGSYTGVCWACVPYTVHTRACMIRRVSFVFLCSLYTVHTRACVGRVSPIHGPYTGVYAGRVSLCFPLTSYTVLVHGRVSQPCVSLVFQNLLFAFLWLQIVLFLVSFHQIVSESFIKRFVWPPNTRYVSLRITPHLWYLGCFK